MNIVLGITQQFNYLCSCSLHQSEYHLSVYNSLLLKYCPIEYFSEVIYQVVKNRSPLTPLIPSEHPPSHLAARDPSIVQYHYHHARLSRQPSKLLSTTFLYLPYNISTTSSPTFSATTPASITQLHALIVFRTSTSVKSTAITLVPTSSFSKFL